MNDKTHDETGGPAFPSADFEHHEHMGMTLRDYFAAKAMHGWLSTYGDRMPIQGVRPEGIAMLAYQIADAMLKVREQ